MADETPFFYCNGLEVTVSPYDISFTLIRQGAKKGVELGVPSDPARLAELVVSMSPMHAKAMLAGMYNAVADYEKKFGPIALTAEVQKTFLDTFGGMPQR